MEHAKACRTPLWKKQFCTRIIPSEIDGKISVCILKTAWQSRLAARYCWEMMEINACQECFVSHFSSQTNLDWFVHKTELSIAILHTIEYGLRDGKLKSFHLIWKIKTQAFFVSSPEKGQQRRFSLASVKGFKFPNNKRCNKTFGKNTASECCLFSGKKQPEQQKKDCKMINYATTRKR